MSLRVDDKPPAGRWRGQLVNDPAFDKLTQISKDTPTVLIFPSGHRVGEKFDLGSRAGRRCSFEQRLGEGYRSRSICGSLAAAGQGPREQAEADEQGQEGRKFHEGK
jgi:hypothetical protein